jgi:hypothetical protein
MLGKIKKGNVLRDRHEEQKDKGKSHKKDDINSNEEKNKHRVCVSTSNASSKFMSSEWFVECAAYDHICFDKKMFVSLKASAGEVLIGMGNVTVEGIGTIELDIMEECGGRSLSLSNVLYVPEFSFNLLSCSKLAKKGVVCKIDEN